MSDMLKDPFNKKMIDNLDECKKILERKREDYADSNFIEAAKVASVLTGKDIEPMDVAACAFGIKCARYRELTTNNKKPVHESLQDTVRDGINYFSLMERERQK